MMKSKAIPRPNSALAEEAPPKPPARQVRPLAQPSWREGEERLLSLRLPGTACPWQAAFPAPAQRPCSAASYWRCEGAGLARGPGPAPALSPRGSRRLLPSVPRTLRRSPARSCEAPPGGLPAPETGRAATALLCRATPAWGGAGELGWSCLPEPRPPPARGGFRFRRRAPSGPRRCGKCSPAARPPSLAGCGDGRAGASTSPPPEARTAQRGR